MLNIQLVSFPWRCPQIADFYHEEASFPINVPLLLPNCYKITVSQSLHINITTPFLMLKRETTLPPNEIPLNLGYPTRLAVSGNASTWVDTDSREKDPGRGIAWKGSCHSQSWTTANWDSSPVTMETAGGVRKDEGNACPLQITPPWVYQARSLARLNVTVCLNRRLSRKARKNKA